MQIEIQDPHFQTLIFSLLLLSIIFLTIIKKQKDQPLFPNNVTQELKGFAILTIIFGHIGYFLDSKDLFLYPLSIASGVGVNLFLFLSGFGLTKSTLKKPLSIFNFYKKRLLKLFLPMWVVLGMLFFLDWIILGIVYEQKTVLYNLFGFFPYADIYTSVNSVLWYFTLILFYYLIFTLFTFSKKILLFSPLIIYLLSVYLLKQDLPLNKDVLTLHKLHTYAFPLGITAALIPKYFSFIPKGKIILSAIVNKLKNHNLILNLILLSFFAYLFYYTALNSKIGENKTTEQIISNITMFAAILFFIIKRFSSKFLRIFGNYSYEIYLIHWPLVYRYDFLYQYLPAFLATFLYLFIMLGLGWCLQKFIEVIATKLKL